MRETLEFGDEWKIVPAPNDRWTVLHFMEIAPNFGWFPWGGDFADVPSAMVAIKHYQEQLEGLTELHTIHVEEDGHHTITTTPIKNKGGRPRKEVV